MQATEFTPDRFTRYILFAIVVLLTIISVELWAFGPDMLPTASAQIPDTGRQRLEIIDETRKTNRLLTQILEQLRDKPIKVSIVTADESRGKSHGPEKP